MAYLKDSLVPAALYNSLPHINEVSDVPEKYSKDLEDLRALLSKHNLPKGVFIRLIHKHYDLKEGESMAFSKVDVPLQGTVTVMHPTNPSETSKLRGVHFFVDEQGCLQAYEYSTTEGPNISNYRSFLEEFCRIVSERGLQMKYGLKLQVDPDEHGWTEFEFPSKRSTIMIPEGMPIPDGKYDLNVVTEWGFLPTKRDCYHCGHICWHCVHVDSHETGVYLGAQKVEPGTPIWGIVNAVIAVC